MSEFGTDPKFHHRSTDPDTSKDSAENVNTVRIERIVFKTIEESGDQGMTAFEINEALDEFSIQTITPRIAPLLRKGFIYRDGSKRRGERMQLVNKANRRKEQQHYWGEDRRQFNSKPKDPKAAIKALKARLEYVEDLFLAMYELGATDTLIEGRVEALVARVVSRQEHNADVDV